MFSANSIKNNYSNENKLSAYAIGGIVSAIVFIVICVVCGIIFIIRKRNINNVKDDTATATNEANTDVDSMFNSVDSKSIENPIWKSGSNSSIYRQSDMEKWQ